MTTLWSSEVVNLQPYTITGYPNLQTGSFPYTSVEVTGDTLQSQLLGRNLPESLVHFPGVLGQKTANGQSSPFLRGFTAFRTLLLVDGIRLNSSIMREGPNQYWGTVDMFAVDSLILTRGPASTLHGSDAIGGVVSVELGPTQLLPTETHQGRLYYRLASAESSHITRAEVSGAIQDQWTVHAGVTYQQFGDLEGGSEVGRQSRTGYQTLAANAKILGQVTPDILLTVAYQYFEQDDAWRSHSTVHGFSWEGSTIGTDLKRQYDQQRQMAYARLEGSPEETLLDWRATVSWQRQTELEDRIRSNQRQRLSSFEINTFGLDLRSRFELPVGVLTSGFDLYRDEVNSARIEFNPDGSLRSISVQGPVGDDATYTLGGIFTEWEWKPTERWLVLVGGRYTFADTEIGRVADPETGTPFSIEESWENIAFSLRVSYELAEKWYLFSGVSQGFRAPNLSDLSRLGGARTGEVEVPSPGLDTEEFVSYEVGLRHRGDRWGGEIAYFYTDISDMITRAPTGEVLDGEFVVTKRNGRDGHVQGVEANFYWLPIEPLRLSADFAWQEGRLTHFPTSQPIAVEEPLSRTLPTTARLKARWTIAESRYWIEGEVVHAEKQDQLAASDMRDTDRIPPGGTPGYTIAHLRGQWQARDGLTLTVAIENLFDEDYRIHGSGVNAAGRNFVTAVDWRF